MGCCLCIYDVVRNKHITFQNTLAKMSLTSNEGPFIHWHNLNFHLTHQCNSKSLKNWIQTWPGPVSGQGLVWFSPAPQDFCTVRSVTPGTLHNTTSVKVTPLLRLKVTRNGKMWLKGRMKAYGMQMKELAFIWDNIHFRRLLFSTWRWPSSLKGLMMCERGTASCAHSCSQLTTFCVHYPIPITTGSKNY